MKRICFYRTCPLCGAYLDPGESCTDCKKGGRTGMTEAEARALVAQLTYAEKVELLAFIKFLVKCQEESFNVTDQKVQEMVAAARDRIAQAERLTA